MRKQLHSLQLRIDRAKPVSCRYFKVKRPPLSPRSARFCVVNYEVYLWREKTNRNVLLWHKRNEDWFSLFGDCTSPCQPQTCCTKFDCADRGNRESDLVFVVWYIINMLYGLIKFYFHMQREAANAWTSSPTRADLLTLVWWMCFTGGDNEQPGSALPPAAGGSRPALPLGTEVAHGKERWWLCLVAANLSIILWGLLRNAVEGMSQEAKGFFFFSPGLYGAIKFL